MAQFIAHFDLVSTHYDGMAIFSFLQRNLIIVLPGGATILCHFWNSVVFRQSRGDKAYALCLDINSCIGSKITHSCRTNRKRISVGKFNVVQ